MTKRELKQLDNEYVTHRDRLIALYNHYPALEEFEKTEFEWHKKQLRLIKGKVDAERSDFIDFILKRCELGRNGEVNPIH